MRHLLGRLRVVECASFIAAPSCALHLAQLGAEVIRIDPLGGGPDRNRWPVGPAGESYYWQGLNKGKKSVTLNLSLPEGREIAAELITAAGSEAGLFVTNYPVGGFLSHERLSARRPDLITLRVMGWADGRPAVDYTVNAAFGVPLMTGPPTLGDQPVNHVLPAWDLLAGAYGAFALLAAESHRRETGLGQEIRLPLSDLAAATLGNLGQVAEVLSHGDRDRNGNDLFGAFGRDFRTRDGKRLMVVAITARQWQALVQTLDLVDAVGELEARFNCSFSTDEGVRFLHRDRLNSLVATAIAERQSSDLTAAFESAGVCWGPYRSLAEAVAEDPIFSSGVFSHMAHPGAAAYPTPAAPARFGATAATGAMTAPELGADTDEVLSTILGFTDARIDDLHQRGIA